MHTHRGGDAVSVQMQLAGFGVLIFLICFYQRRKSVGLYTEVFFKWTMVVTLVNVSMDVLSIAVIVNRDLIPGWLCFVVCKTYLSSLIWTGCCGLLYICQDIYNGRARRYSLRIFGALGVIGNILVFSLPISYYHEEDVVYTYGASIGATYGFCVSFVILTLIMAVCHRRKMNHDRVEAVIMWILVWMIAAIVQFFNNQLLLVGYASCLGMMILFFKLENPEAAIDRETGAYNSHVFLKYMRQLYERGESFSVLLISMEQQRGLEVHYDDARLLDIVKFLQTQGEAKVFKNVEQEFVILFEKKEQLAEGLRRIRQRFIKPWDGILYEPVYVTICDNQMAESAEEIYQLLRYYKQHMEQMDENKIIEIDQEMVEERRRYLHIKEELSEALSEGRVEVFLQPIYSVEKEAFVSAEALARIRRRDGTLISPGQFIPVAEETGLIEILGERVFEKTCQFIQREKIWKLGIEYVEVNLSVRQCESPKLAQSYKNIMERYEVDPSMINLEVTESASIQMRHALLQNMESLIEYGVSFSLDDFGNGESNLNYIVDMPVQIVKFDRDMTKSYFEKDKGKLVMETATRMILDMGLEIVSEGVETKEQLAGMKRLGVQYIQGYLFSRPLPEDEFVQFINKNIK